jgi:uncharacterized paraquat-inducible protein A
MVGRRYDGLAMAEEPESTPTETEDESQSAESTRCPFCGCDNDLEAVTCAKCGRYLKSELECLRAIDLSLTTLKRIAIWWLILSILAVLAGMVGYVATH